MAEKNKLQLEMNPYNAITILAFCREFINDNLSDEYRFKAIHEAVNELEMELAINLTDKHWEQINIEDQVNKLIGKSPL